MLQIRPFARHDRDGLARLANAHAAAVLPGATIPTSTLLAHLERDSDEYIVDPWVIDRTTLVAVEAERVVAAAHLLRYGRGEPVGDDYDDAAEIGWLLSWPESMPAGQALLEGTTDHMRAWGSRVWFADGNLPCAGVYGIPEAWPHVERLVEAFGFDPGRVEVLLAGRLATIDPPGPPPIEGLVVQRRVGALGTRFDAALDGEIIGSFEVDCGLSKGGAHQAMAGWADVANHWVAGPHQRCGVGTWLFTHGCAWLRLGGFERLLAYATEADARDAARFYGTHGIVEIGRTRTGWRREPS